LQSIRKKAGAGIDTKTGDISTADISRVSFRLHQKQR
jgi:hypothetical protein